MADAPYDVTPNMGLGLYHDNDFPGEVALNEMRGKIDDLYMLRDVIANIPASSGTRDQRTFWATDENKLYRDNGSDWEVISVLDHNEMLNPDGGTPGEYFHLTSDEYTALANYVEDGDDVGFGQIDVDTEINMGSNPINLTYGLLEYDGSQLLLQSDTTKDIKINSAKDLLLYSANDLKLKDNNLSNPISLSELGETVLAGHFSANSIMGALNELKSKVYIDTADQALNLRIGDLETTMPTKSATSYVDTADGNLQTQIDNLSIGLSSTILTSVQGIAQLKLVDISGVPDKAMIHCEDTGLYAYDLQRDQAESLPGIVKPTSGSGMWVRINTSYIQSHNDLNGVQGGTTDEYYHLTATEYSALGTHNHDDRYYTETELDAGQLDNRYYTETESNSWRVAHGTSADHDGRYYTETEINTNLYTQTEVDGLFTTHNSSANHDGRYYTETEVDSLLTGKSDTSHIHDGRYYTETEIDTNIYTKTEVDNLISGEDFWDRASTTVTLKNTGDTLDLTGEIFKMGSSQLSNASTVDTWSGAGDTLTMNQWAVMNIGGGNSTTINIDASGSINFKYSGVTVMDIPTNTVIVMQKDVVFGGLTDIEYDNTSNLMRFYDDIPLTFGTSDDLAMNWNSSLGLLQITSLDVDNIIRIDAVDNAILTLNADTVGVSGNRNSYINFISDGGSGVRTIGNTGSPNFLPDGSTLSGGDTTLEANAFVIWNQVDDVGTYFIGNSGGNAYKLAYISEYGLRLNEGENDFNFLIMKNGGGEAFRYDAGVDTFGFGSYVEIGDDIQLGFGAATDASIEWDSANGRFELFSPSGDIRIGRSASQMIEIGNSNITFAASGLFRNRMSTYECYTATYNDRLQLVQDEGSSKGRLYQHGDMDLEILTESGQGKNINIIADNKLVIQSDMYFLGAGTGIPFATMYAKDNFTDTIIGVAGTPVQVTIFNINGVTNQIIPDHTNDYITIPYDGVYEIIISATVESVAGGAIKVALDGYINNGPAGTILPELHAHRDMAGGGGDTGSFSLSGQVSLSANDTLELWITNETSTANLTVEDVTISVKQIGG